jgi:hypothetical protein
MALTAEEMEVVASYHHRSAGAMARPTAGPALVLCQQGELRQVADARSGGNSKSSPTSIAVLQALVRVTAAAAFVSTRFAGAAKIESHAIGDSRSGSTDSGRQRSLRHRSHRGEAASLTRSGSSWDLRVVVSSDGRARAHRRRCRGDKSHSVRSL